MMTIYANKHIFHDIVIKKALLTGEKRFNI